MLMIIWWLQTTQLVPGLIWLPIQRQPNGALVGSFDISAFISATNVFFFRQLEQPISFNFDVRGQLYLPALPARYIVRLQQTAAGYAQTSHLVSYPATFTE
jgi:hypothetical protein